MKGMVTMTKAIATKNEISTKEAKSQLNALTVRMTVALLKSAVKEIKADAETLCDIAHLVCKSLKDLPQTNQISEALRWTNRAMAYDDDTVLARWCLLQALEALTS